MANVIYYMWKPNQEGYIGQDSRFSPEEPTRIEEHIDTLKKKRDSAGDLVYKYGIGGLMYRYYTESENFGLYNTFFEEMASEIGINNNFSSEMKMHIAELMHIAARRQYNVEFSLSASNKAIGGGGLRIDYSNTPEIQGLLRLGANEKIKIISGNWYETGVVKISDVVDLITNPSALHKIYYPKQYAILRLVGFLFEGYLIKQIPEVIQQTAGQILKDKVQKTNSKIFANTLFSYLTSFVDKINKIIGNEGLDAAWILPCEKLQEISDFIEDQMIIALIKSISSQPDLAKQLTDNYQKKHTNKTKWHHIVYITHNNILKALGVHLKSVPKWFTSGVNFINSNGLPQHAVDENVLKDYVKRKFFDMAWSKATEQAASWRQLVNADQSWWKIDSVKHGFLKDRIYREYEKWFAPSATVMQYWDLFYRAMASERSTISVVMWKNDLYTKVVGNSGDAYLYNPWSESLMVFASRFHNNLDSIPFGWF